MPELLFVTAVGQPQQDQGVVRRQIRRQAMSKAAAKRRERGGYGQINKLQYPASVVAPVGSDDSEQQKPCWAPRIPQSPSSTGYERLRIRYGVDLLDLSALTNFHVSQATWSYLDHLPRHAEASAALDAATRCVAARMREFLIYPERLTSHDTLRLYSCALQALQEELGDPSACLSPEALCATQVLGLYELLKVSNVNAWNQHSAGASTLVKLRGPAQYETDFEKSLFLSQIGQIYHEALGQQRACFLEAPEWQAVLDCMVTRHNPFGDRGSFVMRLWKTIIPLPRYIAQVLGALQGDDEHNDHSPERLQLPYLLEGFYNASMTLLEEIRDQDLPCHRHEPQHEDDKPLEARGLLLTAVAIVSRLRFALCPARADLERDAQAAARNILLVNKEVISIHPRAELYMAMKVQVAQTIRVTEQIWLTGDWAGLQRMPSQVLLDWFRLIGWRV
ncbi:hypothetical protein PWT90_08282 [Aphanocladium album]|nr:hypothetical protein PWT90_08282 [Aphanocladium album]